MDHLFKQKLRLKKELLEKRPINRNLYIRLHTLKTYKRRLYHSLKKRVPKIEKRIDNRYKKNLANIELQRIDKEIYQQNKMQKDLFLETLRIFSDPEFFTGPNVSFKKLLRVAFELSEATDQQMMAKGIAEIDEIVNSPGVQGGSELKLAGAKFVVAAQDINKTLKNLERKKRYFRAVADRNNSDARKKINRNYITHQKKVVVKTKKRIIRLRIELLNKKRLTKLLQLKTDEITILKNLLRKEEKTKLKDNKVVIKLVKKTNRILNDCLLAKNYVNLYLQTSKKMHVMLMRATNGIIYYEMILPKLVKENISFIWRHFRSYEDYFIEYHHQLF